VDPERWARVRALFEAAVDLPESEWDAWLQRACEQSDLRAEVAAMLAADARTGASRLPQRVPALVDGYARAAADTRIGERCGPWRLLRLLGEGGMGSVYLAERMDGGFTQQAALKVVRSGFAQADLLARLGTERQILAGLQHPNIAALLDGGADATGAPYLAMEYVQGVDLRSHCDAARLDLRARLHLFLTVCAAVAHAHAHLVVHRDLKPANIMVTPGGTVKLLDFGVAKLLLDSRAQEATVAQHRVFTPEYAAPEQIGGGPTTTGVDVYALGVVLFELLTGHRPYQAAGSGVAGVEHAVLHSDPGRPSSCATAASGGGGEAGCNARAQQRATTPLALRRQLRGDLDAIVLRALRRRPEARYASVRLLAADVEAWLERRPVSARRGSLRYRSGRFVRRHALAVGLAALAVSSLLLGSGLALWQMQAARNEAATSREVLEFMQQLFALADPEQASGRDVSARELLASGSRRIRTALDRQPAARSVLLEAMGEAHLGLGLDAEALPLLEDALQLSASAAEPAGRQRLQLLRARALHGLGRFQQVLDELSPLRAVAGSDSAGSLFVAALDNRLGRAAQALGQTALAERHHVAALRTLEARLGLAHADTQEVVVALVSVYEMQRRHDEALALARRGLAALDNGAPRDERVRADALSALAMVQTNLGALAEAERLRREVLSAYREIYGDDHGTTVGAINNLASVVFAQRHYAEARGMFEQVLAARRRLYSAEHPRIALAANNAALAQLLTGDTGSALASAEEARALRVAAFGVQHPLSAQSMVTVGAVLLALGRLDAAEDELVQALAGFSAAFGADNRQSIAAHNNLGLIQLARGTVPPDCRHGDRAVALLGDGVAADDRGRIYAEALQQACRARRGDSGARGRLADSTRAYRDAAGSADPYLPVLDGLLAAVDGGETAAADRWQLAVSALGMQPTLR